MLQDFYQTQKFIELNLNSLEQRIKPSQEEGFSFKPNLYILEVLLTINQIK